MLNKAEKYATTLYSYQKAGVLVSCTLVTTKRRLFPTVTTLEWEAQIEE